MLFTGLAHDFRYAVRSLLRSPALTLGIIATFALGLGLNVATFSFLDRLFVRAPQGVQEPGTLRRIWVLRSFATGSQFWSGFSYPEFEAVRSAVGDAAAVTMYAPPRPSDIGPAGSSESAVASHVPASYFDVLGTQPALGRFFAPDEDVLGSPIRVAVVSHAYWRTRLGGDPAALQRSVVVGRDAYRIIGVAQRGFAGLELDATDIWLPLATMSNRGAAPWWQGHEINAFQVVARIRVDQTAATIGRRVAAGLRQSAARRTAGDSTGSVMLASIIRARGPGERPHELTISTRLGVVAAIVLLITLANSVHLILARLVRREREIGVRQALGISRGRLARLLFLEVGIVGVAAAFLAIVTGHTGSRVLQAWLFPDVRWSTDIPTLDAVGLAGGALSAIVITLATALWPLLRALRLQPIRVLRDGVSAGTPGMRIQATLIAVQAALSVVLLVGAALFIASLVNVRRVRIGFDAPRLLFGSVRYETRDSVRDAWQSDALRRVAVRLADAPGVERVALSRLPPTRGFGMLDYIPDVDTLRYPRPLATYSLVSRDFFAMVGTRLMRGSGFHNAAGATRSVVINEAFARAQWPGIDALGRCMRFAPNGDCYQIVGITENAMFDKVIDEPRPQFYLSLDAPPPQAGTQFSTVIVRAQPGQRDAARATLQRTLQDVFPGSRVTVTSMLDYLEPQYRPWRLGANLFAALGVIALLVAAIGMYSTVTYTVARQTRDLGIRAALGARSGDLLRHVYATGLPSVALGIAAGVGLALLGGRFISSLLFGVVPADIPTLVGVAALLLLVAVLAILGPARRASRTDPVSAMRAD